MHRQVEVFLTDPGHAAYFDGATVLEVGSYDVNGSPRRLVGGAARHWLGIDRLPGPGVDLVGDAADVMQAYDLSADVVVSTEALEHDEHVVVGPTTGVIARHGRTVEHDRDEAESMLRLQFRDQFIMLHRVHPARTRRPAPTLDHRPSATAIPNLPATTCTAAAGHPASKSAEPAAAGASAESAPAPASESASSTRSSTG